MAGWQPPTMIYVALRPDGIRKIGSTQNIELRLREIRRCYATRYTCEWTRDIPGGWANHVEQYVHTNLEDYRVDVGMGSREHYRVPLEKIAAVIEACGNPSKWGLHYSVQARSSEAEAYRLQSEIRRLRGPIGSGYISIDDAAKRLGCSRITVIRGLERVKKAKAKERGQ